MNAQGQRHHQIKKANGILFCVLEAARYHDVPINCRIINALKGAGGYEIGCNHDDDHDHNQEEHRVDAFQ